MRDAVPPCGTRRRGGAGTKAPEPPPPPPGPPIPSRPTPPGAPGGDPGGPSRPAPRPSALDNTSYHTRGTHSEPLPEQPSQYRLPEIRPDARRITFPVTITGGSSPLARGLPFHLFWDDFSLRIIPARAGFTRILLSSLSAVEDHPRSRGVYLGPVERRFGFVGSSPLARGLRVPADAQTSASLDHPRSRGVYPREGEAVTVAEGSSPLARGLRAHGEHAEHDPGIIPARAGFTMHKNTVECIKWDHPRSRGVYRALPRPGDARRGDHPRSRGVYGLTAYSRGGVPGSSPLARGLRGGRRPLRGGAGIIPARAGFTCTTATLPRRCADHPRSRGVYLNAVAGGNAQTGSSPLARGLHECSHAHLLRHGIIPARAGFT